MTAIRIPTLWPIRRLARFSPIFSMAAALGYAADTNLAAPRNLTASDGTYGDRVVLAWNAVAQAAHYEVWRNTQNDSGGVAPLAAAVTAASFTDTDVVRTVYWYWVQRGQRFPNQCVQRSQYGLCRRHSAGAAGRPVIRANGATGAVAVASGDALFATVALNAGEYAGIPADWWVVAVPTAGNWFYLNSFLQWMPVAAGDLGACRPAYQGALFRPAGSHSAGSGATAGWDLLSVFRRGHVGWHDQLSGRPDIVRFRDRDGAVGNEGDGGVSEAGCGGWCGWGV